MLNTSTPIDGDTTDVSFAYTVRKSHENPALGRLYERFLTDGPCGHKSHELLHTSYTPRGTYIV